MIELYDPAAHERGVPYEGLGRPRGKRRRNRSPGRATQEEPSPRGARLPRITTTNMGAPHNGAGLALLTLVSYPGTYQALDQARGDGS
ncbi:hypothetical protein GCM10018965_088000 [Nonomuraea roseola]